MKKLSLLVSVFCLTVSLPCLAKSASSTVQNGGFKDVKRVRVLQELEIPKQPNSTTTTWVHLRNGKVDAYSTASRRSYNSHGKPYCTLAVNYDSGRIRTVSAKSGSGKKDVLPVETELAAKWSEKDFVSLEGGYLQCSVDSNTLKGNLTDAMVQQALGSLVEIE
jgi:hypothetical protein